ncbi:MAG: hypothetical protein KDD89_06500 [Anaerolineales bacterium]|nr:hypothetical protein [Anaerolineales bacterium]
MTDPIIYTPLGERLQFGAGWITRAIRKVLFLNLPEEGQQRALYRAIAADMAKADDYDGKIDELYDEIEQLQDKMSTWQERRRETLARIAQRKEYYEQTFGPLEACPPPPEMDTSANYQLFEVTP